MFLAAKPGSHAIACMLTTNLACATTPAIALVVAQDFILKRFAMGAIQCIKLSDCLRRFQPLYVLPMPDHAVCLSHDNC